MDHHDLVAASGGRAGGAGDPRLGGGRRSAGSNQTRALTPAFIDRYSIVGPSIAAWPVSEEFEAVGIGKVIIVGSSAGADRDQARTSGRHLVEDVLPAFAIT